MCLNAKKIVGLLLLVSSCVVPLRAQEARWNELNAQVEQFARQGKYAEAIPPAQESLSVAEVTFGPEHFNVAQSLNNLAWLYGKQGRYAEAEPPYKRALAIWEKALGPDHPYVASSMNSLAALYYHQGRYAEAEPLYKRALAIREKALGPDHPSVAGSLNNLAALHDNQGRYGEAEPLFERALAIDEKAFGPDHPSVAESLNSLAALYYNQGRYAEAEPFLKRALAIREKALGPDRPSVAESLNSLAAGDGLMVIFGVPLSGGVNQDACCAVRCALQMLKRVEGLNAELNSNGGGPPIRIGIGIHTGPLTCGSVGSEKRFEYSVIGEAVNLASRLESLTKDLHAPIIMSESTQRLVREYFKGTRDLGKTKVRGIDGEIHVYTVEGSDQNHSVAHLEA